MTYTFTSADGTRIAYDRTGDGPPLIIVDGAMCYRGQGPSGPLAAELAGEFTVFTYDRRGRGESGESREVALEREVEDIEALAKEAGGAPHLFGASSGAVLALEAANHGVGVSRLGMYEPPLIVDDTHRPLPDDWETRLDAMIAEGRTGDAVKAFMRFVDVPGFGVAIMRLLPVWSKLKGVAPSLRHDFAFMAELQRGRPLPETRWSTVTQPALVADGGKSPDWMHHGCRALSEVLPNATYRTVPGQTHIVKAKALAPVLREFFAA
ncbi:MAG TPA: alpha/beta hydrolase [Actinophytocola sp.]|jgi:pimeloyl-ACP methyl ester carboxylesterase|uniref:alpha/beta fold hydrolase n=1 Tax=Actinophytocola sp. TaxID=1872138 RepID=UPI002F945F54